MQVTAPDAPSPTSSVLIKRMCAASSSWHVAWEPSRSLHDVHEHSLASSCELQVVAHSQNTHMQAVVPCGNGDGVSCGVHGHARSLTACLP